MTVGTRVYVARLAGVAVFDPNGDAVGRFRDVVVMFRPDRLPPRVLGLLVELQHRRRIFVPIGRVTSIEAGAVVLSSGSVNLRRFEQRPGEALVLGALLDRTATIRETDAKVTVIDAAMEQTRTKDWVLTRLAVRDLGSRLARRRGQVRQVEWEELDGLGPTAEAEQGADALLNVLSTSRPADIANMLQDLDPKRRHEIAAALDDERLADVLEELPEDTQVKILASLADERAADILEEMDPDDAADLLAELAPSERERLFQLMEPGEAATVRRLLRYGDDTAGGLMTSEPIILAPDATIAEALARVRNPDITPALATQVYVCRPPSETPTGRYLGVAHVQRLLREPPSALVSGVVDDDLEPVRPETELSVLTRYLATYDLVAAAVVDEADRLVGAVTVDDVLDHLLPEDWRERDIDG
ncbi:MAG TPA: CBS domain-containing protein [Mycobacteriales bacterium]|nr:CBS domain-containing protein [Mycobacteriales bacterium]